MSVNVKLITGEEIGVKLVEGEKIGVNLGTLHNSFFGLQGGSETERFHLTESEVDLIHQNTGDIATISGLLNNDQLTDIVFQTGDQTISGIKSFDEDVVFNADINSAGNINQTGNYNISGNVSINGGINTVDSIQFNTSAGVTVGQGEIAWNSEDLTLDLGIDNVTLQVGQEQVLRVKCADSLGVYDGMPVYAYGTIGGSDNIEIKRFSAADDFVDELYFLGIATEDIAENGVGFVTTFGKVREVDGRAYGTGQGVKDPADTSDWEFGNVLYVSPNVAGTLTKVIPTAPNKRIPVAMVLKAPNQHNITLMVRAEHGYHLNEIHDVYSSSPSDGQALIYNQANQRWENTTLNLAYLPLSGGTLNGSLDVNGDLSVDGSVLHVDSTNNRVGIGTTSPSARLELKGSTADSSANAFVARDSASAALFSIRNDGRIDATGNVVIGGTLTVNGTTTTINSTTISVDDKNIELGSVGTPTDTTADGGGITLKGATDKTLTWVDSTDSWTSNQTFSAPNLTLTSLSNQSSEATALVINGSNVVGYRELGTNAFNSTAFITASSTDTLTNKTWNGNVIASAYLDADTAHLSGTQTFSGAKTFSSAVTLSSIAAATSDLDKFLVSDSGVVKYRTGAQVLSDIGGAAASHNHAASEITSGTLDADRLPRPTSGDWWNGGAVVVGTDGVMELGKFLDFHVSDTGTSDYDVRITATNNAISVGGSLTATSLIKSGGTSSQFLKADGSVDSNTYLTTGSAASTYLPLTGGTVTGTTTFDGLVNGIYHGVEEDHYYFDDYNGRRNINVFLKTSRADIIKYQPVDNLEYWDGSAWQDGSSELSNLKNLLDGRQDTSWAVPSTYYKFRFTVTASTSWPTMALIGAQLSWTGSTYPDWTMTVEEKQTDNSWSTKVTADFSSSNGVSNWGTMFRADTALHTGQGSQSQGTRITIDFYGWTPSNPSYNTIPLQNLFIYSNYAGSENNDYQNLLNYDRNVTLPSKLYITTADTNTSSTSALVLNGTEVEKRTLGSAAFSNTSAFATADQGTSAETAYGWGNHADSGYLTAHPTISAASSSDNSGRTYIQDILLDSNGHVTGITTATETVTNTTYSAGNGLTLSGTTFKIDDPVNLSQLTESTDATDDKFLIWDESTSLWKYMTLDDLQDAIDTNTTYTLSSFGVTATAAELNTLDGITATTAELNYTDGVTSNIQTQLDGKASSTHNHTLDSLSNVTISSNASGEILKWNGSAWVNNTLSEAGIQASSTALTTSTTFGGDVSGTYNSIVVANDSHTHNANNLTGTTLASGVTASSLTSVGTIGTGTWQGSVIASAYLDSDTAHLSGTQTFSGAKTFGSNATFNSNLDVSSSIRRTGDTDTYINFGTADQIHMFAGGTRMISLVEGATDSVIFNDAGVDVDFRVEGSGEANALFVQGSNGNVGIGTNTPSAKLEVNGHFTATTKSFLVDNPRTGGKLQYGVVESDHHSVFVRGKNDTNTIELPEEWDWLVDEDSVTVTIAPVGKFQQLYVISQGNKVVEVGGVDGEYNYVVYGTRKDVEALEVNV